MKNRVRVLLLVLGLLGSAACASVRSAPTTTQRKFTRVNVSVQGWAAEAVLIDGDGRRTGWTRDAWLREINGCGSQSGWGDDWEDDSPRPDESDSTDAAAWREARLRDSTYAASDPPPDWHHFDIGNNRNYRAGGPPGLIDKGSCELQLVPIHAGTLHLAINAEGVGFQGCEDTTSVLIVPGTPQRWRLSWKHDGDSCVVKISRLGERSSARRPRE